MAVGISRPRDRADRMIQGAATVDDYDWDALASQWSRDNPQALWRRHSDAVNTSLLERWLPAERVGAILKTDLFDEAFAEGLIPLLATRAAAVYGIDVSERVVEIVRARHPQLHALTADVRDLPFPEAMFDVVVSISTLDHFATHAEIDRALAELHRTLKPGGVLLLTLDNRANPVVALRNALPFRPLRAIGLVPYYVGATYGPRGLAQAATRAGFRLQASTATMHCPRVLAVPLASRVQARAQPRAWERLARGLMRFEQLAKLPTRYLTGHYVAVRALKI
jgi:SAM-dependent methyltransferase